MYLGETNQCPIKIATGVVLLEVVLDLLDLGWIGVCVDVRSHVLATMMMVLVAQRLVLELSFRLCHAAITVRFQLADDVQDMLYLRLGICRDLDFLKLLMLPVLVSLQETCLGLL